MDIMLYISHTMTKNVKCVTDPSAPARKDFRAEGREALCV